MEAAPDVAYAEFCSGIEQSEPGAALPEAELSAEEMPEPEQTGAEDGQESPEQPLLTGSEEGLGSPEREEMKALNTSQAARSARGQRLAGELQSAEHNLADVTRDLASTIASRRRRCASSDPGCLCLRLPPRSDAIGRTDLRMWLDARLEQQSAQLQVARGDGSAAAKKTAALLVRREIPRTLCAIRSIVDTRVRPQQARLRQAPGWFLGASSRHATRRSPGASASPPARRRAGS